MGIAEVRIMDVASRDPEHVCYGRAFQLDVTAVLKDPKGAGPAIQATIEADVAGLDDGAGGRDGMELLPDAVP